MGLAVHMAVHMAALQDDLIYPDAGLAFAKASPAHSVLLPSLSPALNFADLFVDGCDVRLVQNADCRVKAALPDGSMMDLQVVYSGALRPKDFKFEYAGWAAVAA